VFDHDLAPHDVQQLADRDRGRALDVGALVVAGVGDDQPVLRGQQRVQQELAVLGARVAVADVGIVEQQVVTVTRRLARERPVVEAEQADDPVRDRAHRHQGADRQVAGAEVRARRAPLQALGEQRADLGQRELRGVPGRLAHHVGQQPLQLRALPALQRRRRGQRVGRVGQRLGPRAQRLRAVQRVDRGLQPVDELREPPGELDRAAVDVVEREHAAEQPPLVLVHRHADQQPVQPGAPGARAQRGEFERRAVLGVQAPADPALGHPVLEARDVVVVEPEALAHRLAVGEVDHLGRGQPLAGQVQDARDDAEDRVRLAQ
jgi:hypothetical protein